jgi:hypothetical protein
MPSIPDRERIVLLAFARRELERREQAASIPIADKVKHVKRLGQTRNHHCHWLGCNAQVPPAKWGCYRHWLMLPRRLRSAIWDAYRPGQESNRTPSIQYLALAREVQEWIKENHGG